MAELHGNRFTYDPGPTGPAFTVERLYGDHTLISELNSCARAMGDIMFKSWQGKLDGKVSDEDIQTVIPEPTEQLRRIQTPTSHGRYWVAHNAGIATEQIADADDVNGFLRVELYTPRFNRLKPPYPNVTDLESRSGNIRGAFEPQAAALLYFSLGEFEAEPDPSVSAYELEGSDGIDFYLEHGLKRQRTVPKQKIGDSEVGTVHLVGKSNRLVRAALESNFPWLGVAQLR